VIEATATSWETLQSCTAVIVSVQFYPRAEEERDAKEQVRWFVSLCFVDLY
jgi:hypothetical protein